LKVLLAGTSSDAHTWNLVYMQMLIEEFGHDVRNLGCCVPDELLLGEAVRMAPGLIVMSTVNGHGFIDGSRAVRHLRESAALREVPIVIGGKLGVAGGGREEGVQTMLDAGFTAVYEDDHAAMMNFHYFVGSLSCPSIKVGN
jgi:methylaspartate mutase sigma subunit